MTTPRLRPELQATPSEEQGIRFFDVSDPRSQNRMRLYDFEWLLASQMDGQRSLDELARWARGSLQLEISSANLAAYAQRLAELGFLSAPEAPASISPRDTGGGTTPIPPPAPASDDDDIQMEVDEDAVTTTRQEALPPRQAEPARAATPSPSSRPDATERQATPPGAAAADGAAPSREWQRADTTGTSETTSTRPKAGSSGTMIGLVVALLVVGGIVAYVTMFSGGRAGGVAKVTTQPAATREVVSLHEGAAKLGKSDGRTLSFGEAGKVTDVVAAGTEVKAGMPLATLDGYAKVEKELTDVKDRLGFYQKQLDSATAKGDAEAQKAAEGKVAEKKKLHAELEARAAKLRLVAPGPGVVGKVHVAAGAEVKANQPAVDVSDNSISATFTVPADAAAAMKAGDQVQLQAAAGGAAVPATVLKVEGDKVSVGIGDDAPLKAGDDVRLVKSRTAGAIAVPASAVVKKNGVDTVFVLANGVVQARPVTVADRSGTDVVVSKGVAAGEQVVTTGAESLTDGQKAAASP